MELALTVALSALSIFIVGTHAVVGKAHFRSKVMPPGAHLVAVSVLVTLCVFLLLLWSATTPVPALIGALVLEGLSLWLFRATVTASRSRALHFAFDPDNPVSLVTEGPYRAVRHPFYTSYILFWGGLALGTWSLWSIPVLAVMVTLYFVAARGEERKFLATDMAGDYANYRARAGMFVPRLGGNRG
jgi:protein-S-isoprenylcysteine O-methyltransferase Ste14